MKCNCGCSTFSFRPEWFSTGIYCVNCNKIISENDLPIPDELKCKLIQQVELWMAHVNDKDIIYSGYNQDSILLIHKLSPYIRILLSPVMEESI